MSDGTAGTQAGPQPSGAAGSRLRAFVELVRAGNAVAAGILTFIGGFVEAGIPDNGSALGALGLAVVATILAVGAGNAVNDYFDREIDRINRPSRPIPSGRVSARETLVFSGGLFIGAVAAVVTLPPTAIGIAAFNLAALLAYTEFFKGVPLLGNVVVAYLTGSTFLFGAAALVGSNVRADVVVLFVLAGLATLAREIVKDVEDTAGDRAEGLQTLPIVVGESAALGLAIVIMTAGVLASGYPFVRGTFGIAYLVLVIPADVVMLGATAWGFKQPGRAHRWLKRGMFLATAAFLIGRAWTVVL